MAGAAQRRRRGAGQGDPDLYRTGHLPSPTGFQNTPLMVGGVLYFNTPLSQGVAVDAKTGETLWVFNPKSYEEGTTTTTGTWCQRGVAYRTDGEGDERIFWDTGNGYVVCVKAKTGRPCADFGPDGSGMVDAMVGLPRATRGERDYLNALLYGIHSPPITVEHSMSEPVWSGRSAFVRFSVDDVGVAGRNDLGPGN